MDDINGKEEKYTGEVGPDGLPHGRGTIDFGDGRRYSGTIDGASQTGRGVYYYPDGSRFIGGFTVNTEYPAWRFVYPDGRRLRSLSVVFRPATKKWGAGNLEIDALCAEITRAAKALGLWSSTTPGPY